MNQETYIRQVVFVSNMTPLRLLPHPTRCHLFCHSAQLNATIPLTVSDSLSTFNSTKSATIRAAKQREKERDLEGGWSENRWSGPTHSTIPSLFRVAAWVLYSCSVWIRWVFEWYIIFALRFSFATCRVWGRRKLCSWGASESWFDEFAKVDSVTAYAKWDAPWIKQFISFQLSHATQAYPNR